MKAGRTQPKGATTLFPYPEGWYFIAARKTIERKKLIQKTWMGEQIVVWCDDEGRICVAEDLCPHLGSELNPAVGGMVRNGCLVCPFHGFEYDATGQCVKTPYAPAPKTARLNVFETREILGLVFAWRGVDGRPPQWDLPEEPAGEDWSDLETWSVKFTGHPQETTENSVDDGHLRYVHGFGSVRRVGAIEVEGAYLKSSFDFTRSQKIAGINIYTYDVSAVTHVHGLGYSYVEVREHGIGMETRLWVLATPVDGETLDMALVSQVKRIRKPKRAIIGMRFLPVGLRTWLMNKIIIAAQRRDVLSDVVIWDRKHYIPRPRLCGSDGEIGTFRRYCEQFYPEPSD